MTINFSRQCIGVLVLQCLLVIAARLSPIGATPAKAEDDPPKRLATSGTKNENQSKSETPDPKEKGRILSEYGRSPLQFEANGGQAVPEVQFFARGRNYDVYLLKDEVVFAFPELRPDGPPDGLLKQRAATRRKPATAAQSESYVSMRLLGSRDTQAIGRDRLPTTVNYFIGNDPKKWRRGVPVFAKVEYPELVPSVDMDFHGVRQQPEFDLIVHPGADVSGLGLAFDGSRRLRVDSSGDLSVFCRSGELRLLKPIAYQQIEDRRVPVDVEFVRKKHHRIAFRFGAYDPKRDLIIDPSVVYSGYLGGNSQDEAMGVAVDSEGNAYLTGATSSPNFPTQFGYQTSLSGTIDAFVTKFNSQGNFDSQSQTFSTYYGGSSTTYGTAIAVMDIPQQQAVYITGYTDSSDLVTSYWPYGGGLDAFVLMLDLSGQLFLGATYIGGSQDDVGTGISIDSEGYAWVVGSTNSPYPTFPLQNPLQDNLKGQMNAFITQVYPYAQGFAFSTYWGGSKRDFATAVAIDNPLITDYDVYLTGGTNSPDFPTTPFAVQTKCGTDGQCNGGKDDAFVTTIKFPSGHYAPNYSSFLGGENQDIGYGIAADIDGHAYITGQTSSTQFPTTSGAYQSSIHGPQNAFVTQFNPDGTALAYSTFLGGSSKDAGLGIAVDSSSNIYITGRTLSSDFPTLNATQSSIGGRQDAFVSTFAPVNNNPTLAFSTFLGGSGDEDLAGGSIAVDSSQNAYAVGDTNSSDFTVTSGVFQQHFAGSGTCTINNMQVPCEDAFITKFLTLESPTLTVNMTGRGIATVTSNPPGIDCSQIPGSCSAKFNFGTQVTLTELPTNTTFNGWSGAGCSGTGDCVVTLTSDQTVTADFSLNITNVSLTVSIAGNGHGKVVSSPSGIDCVVDTHGTNGVCSTDFQQGTVITLTATPNSDSTFTGWPGDMNCPGTAPCTFTLNNPMTVQAKFDLDEPVLTVNAEGDPNSGIVTSSPSGISCTPPATCSATFLPGTTVTLEAKAFGDYAFAGWNGQSNCVGTGDCIIAMNSNQSVTAVFASANQSNLNVQLQGTGSGTVTSNPAGIKCLPTCTAPFNIGTTVALTAIPDSSSTFNSWAGAAISCGMNPTCVVTINSFLVGVIATFDQIYVPPPPPFSLAASPPGGATVPVGGSTAFGLTLVSSNGFTDTINLACSVQPTSSSSPGCTLVPSSVNLGANQAASATLTISAGGLVSRSAPPSSRGRGSYELIASVLMFSFVGGLWSIPKGKSYKGAWNRLKSALVLILAALAIQVACGGGGKSGGSASSGGNAQPGNYIVTVTATGSMTQVSQSLTIPVTVQ